MRPFRAIAVAAAAVGLVGVTGCSLPSLLITPVGSSPVLEESLVDAGSKKSKIALIELEGMLANTRAGSGGLLGASENKVSLLQQQLDVAAADDRVKVVVLRINSPGGTVGGSEAMYDMVRDFKDRTGKPVLVHCQDVCASGGYYVACAADEIYAQNASIVGSIGVIFEVFSASEAMEKVGLSVTTIKSGDLKDMGSPFRPLDPKAQEVLQGLIDDFYAQFKGVVTSNRDIDDPETTFDGRVFTAEQAMDRGLIDGVQTLPETLDRARALAGSSQSSVIMYRRPYGYTGSIYASSPLDTPRADSGTAGEMMQAAGVVAEEMGIFLRPGAYYLWRP